eukprot:TRINITY_DN307_c0_g2_i4.p1 TRINITY_DN307_c0_g2~~TRINITY_DN307_c0_g2_i4.p1  ORF type:complete len:307 (+),score=67.68 TRINITY_DN307_c0_g2_i4:155-1075(+)
MGAYLSKPKTEKVSETGETKNGGVKVKFCATGMQGWRVNMEDAHIANTQMSQNCQLFAVFDGHGGPEVAQFCKVKFCEELEENPNFKNGNYSQALTETFYKMDDILKSTEGKQQLAKIRKAQEQSGDESMAGCTSNVCLITQSRIYVANAGDSRTNICANGQLVEMSQDHKPDDPAEKDRIQKAGGEVWEGRVNGNLNLSRAIGDLEYKQDTNLKADEQLIIAKPDIKEYNLTNTEKVDFIIMGCDGIWECMTNQQVIKHFEKEIKINKQPLQTAVEAFLDQILAKDTSGLHGLDNMTLVVIEFQK